MDPKQMNEFPRIEPELVTALSSHPALEIAETLGTYCKIGCDQIGFSIFLCLAASALRCPIFLEVITDVIGIDIPLTDRILSLGRSFVATPKTVKALHDFADRDFKGTQLIWIRRDEKHLFRHASEIINGDLDSHPHLPGLIVISDRQSGQLPIGPVLILISRKSERTLLGCGYLFSSPESGHHGDARTRLHELVEKLGTVTRPGCPFESHIRGSLRAEDSVLFHRVMRTLAALRICWKSDQNCAPEATQQDCTLDDYKVARQFLGFLPLSRSDSQLSAHAVKTGTNIYHLIETGKLKCEPNPDDPEFGKSPFDRTSVGSVTGHSYNTVKAHLQELEDEGILRSTRASWKRERGRQILFHFVQGRSPPFISRNPFLNLPTADKIAAIWNQQLQL